jgi:hypothetical protein
MTGGSGYRSAAGAAHLRLDGDYLTRRPAAVGEGGRVLCRLGDRSKAGIIERLIAVKPR